VRSIRQLSKSLRRNTSPTPGLNAQILEAGFDRLAPWVTRFTIEGHDYGGALSFDDDPRISQFIARFPAVATVLELGSLEGGQTFQLARRLNATIVAIEGRADNLARAKWVQELIGATNVTFLEADLERTPLSSFGSFDAVFCSGLLYHLPEPWRLIDGLATTSPRVFIWTHYSCDEDADLERAGIRGRWYVEQGLSDPLSGLSPRSFWMTLPSLVARLERNGFRVEIIDINETHPHGPAVTLAAIYGSEQSSFDPSPVGPPMK